MFIIGVMCFMMCLCIITIIIIIIINISSSSSSSSIIINIISLVLVDGPESLLLHEADELHQVLSLRRALDLLEAGDELLRGHCTSPIRTLPRPLSWEVGGTLVCDWWSACLGKP